MQSRRTVSNRREADELLDGIPTGPDSLTQLFAAARASGASANTTGLAQALTDLAERSAHPRVAPTEPRRSVLQAVIARIAAAKMLVIAAFAVLATGGIALAATTGTIPNPLPESPHTSASTPEATETQSPSAPSAPAHEQPGSPTSISASGTQTGPNSPPVNSAETGPSPSLTGLCTSWLARPHTNGNADDSAAFSALIAAAGGIDAVDGYCTALLASGSATATQPSTPGEASTAPSGQKTHSNGKVTGKSS